MPPTTTAVLPLETPIAQALPRKHGSPPDADTVVSMLRSLTVDDDYFHRRALRSVCIQRSPLDDFLPQASEIVPGLFLSDMYTATSPAVLQHLGITHVASVLRKPSHRYPASITHLCVPVDDRTDTNLLDYLDAAVAWIDCALARGGRVLVHCVWGMSRSASVVIAYLVAARALSLQEAHSLARARRRVVRPNAGFMAQLEVYERVTRLREASARRVACSHADTDLELLARRVGMPAGVSAPA
ncbi:protein-tyrosine phosphatase-like protein [Trametes elegans]|nr:protein-tyrosine phosphatase-like protein [Trametes elegans]